MIYNMYALKNELNMYFVSVVDGKVKSTRNKKDASLFVDAPKAEKVKNLLKNKDWEVVKIAKEA